jgi:hypothetical protein
MHRLAVAVVAAAAAVLTVAAAPVPSGSDLAVVQMDPAPVGPGGTTTVHAFVANLGPDVTALPFSVLVVLPWGARAVGPFFPADCDAFAGGSAVLCTFPAGLPPLRTATALIPVQISPGQLARQTLTGGRVTVVSAEDNDPRDNTAPFAIAISAPAGATAPGRAPDPGRPFAQW